MNRFLKLTLLFAVAVSFTALANESFAKGPVKAKPARTHKHRINEYGNGIPNPDNDSNGDESGTGTNYPAPTTFGTGTGHGRPVHGGGNGNPPVKPHPKPIFGKFPTGADKAL
jgi:hypothetical protein